MQLFLLRIAGVNLLENFRSPVLFLLVAMVLVLPVIPERIGKLQLLPRAGGVLRVVVLTGLALIAGKSAVVLIDLVTSAGLIGEEAQAKNEEEAKGGVLLGGRPEILVSSRAVWDSPVLGHGSEAKDFKYVEMLNDLRAEAGMQANLADLEASSADMIPTHSHLMGAWVWAGILGAVFWAYILWLAGKGILEVSTLLPPSAPLYAYVIIGLFWNVLFSPFGQSARMGDALAIVIVIDLLGTRPIASANAWARSGRFAGRSFARRTNLRATLRPR